MFLSCSPALQVGMQVKIIEQNLKRCEELCELFRRQRLFTEMQPIMIFLWKKESMKRTH